MPLDIFGNEIEPGAAGADESASRIDNARDEAGRSRREYLAKLDFMEKYAQSDWERNKIAKRRRNIEDERFFDDNALAPARRENYLAGIERDFEAFKSRRSGWNAMGDALERGVGRLGAGVADLGIDAARLLQITDREGAVKAHGAVHDWQAGVEAANPQAVGSIRNIHGVGDALMWGGEAILENAPAMVGATAAAMATGGVGGAALGATIMGAQNTGEAYHDRYEEGRDLGNVGNIYGQAAAYTALDSVGGVGRGVSRAAKAGAVLRRSGRKAAREAWRAEARETMTKTFREFYNKSGREWLKSFRNDLLAEGVTEPLQSQVAARGFRAAETGSWFTPEERKQIEEGASPASLVLWATAEESLAAMASASVSSGYSAGRSYAAARSAVGQANRVVGTVFDGMRRASAGRDLAIARTLNESDVFNQMDNADKVLVMQHLSAVANRQIAVEMDRAEGAGGRAVTTRQDAMDAVLANTDAMMSDNARDVVNEFRRTFDVDAANYTEEDLKPFVARFGNRFATGADDAARSLNMMPAVSFNGNEGSETIQCGDTGISIEVLDGGEGAQETAFYLRQAPGRRESIGQHVFSSLEEAVAAAQTLDRANQLHDARINYVKSVAEEMNRRIGGLPGAKAQAATADGAVTVLDTFDDRLLDRANPAAQDYVQRARLMLPAEARELADRPLEMEKYLRGLRENEEANREKIDAVEGYKRLMAIRSAPAVTLQGIDGGHVYISAENCKDPFTLLVALLHENGHYSVTKALADKGFEGSELDEARRKVFGGRGMDALRAEEVFVSQNALLSLDERKEMQGFFAKLRRACDAVGLRFGDMTVRNVNDIFGAIEGLEGPRAAERAEEGAEEASMPPPGPAPARPAAPRPAPPVSPEAEARAGDIVNGILDGAPAAAETPAPAPAPAPAEASTPAATPATAEGEGEATNEKPEASADETPAAEEPGREGQAPRESGAELANTGEGAAQAGAAAAAENAGPVGTPAQETTQNAPAPVADMTDEELIKEQTRLVKARGKGAKKRAARKAEVTKELKRRGYSRDNKGKWSKPAPAAVAPSPTQEATPAQEAAPTQETPTQEAATAPETPAESAAEAPTQETRPLDEENSPKLNGNAANVQEPVNEATESGASLTTPTGQGTAAAQEETPPAGMTDEERGRVRQVLTTLSERGEDSVPTEDGVFLLKMVAEHESECEAIDAEVARELADRKAGQKAKAESSATPLLSFKDNYDFSRLDKPPEGGETPIERRTRTTYRRAMQILKERDGAISFHQAIQTALQEMDAERRERANARRAKRAAKDAAEGRERVRVPKGVIDIADEMAKDDDWKAAAQSLRAYGYSIVSAEDADRFRDAHPDWEDEVVGGEHRFRPPEMAEINRAAQAEEVRRRREAEVDAARANEARNARVDELAGKTDVARAWSRRGDTDDGSFVLEFTTRNGSQFALYDANGKKVGRRLREKPAGYTADITTTDAAARRRRREALTETLANGGAPTVRDARGDVENASSDWDGNSLRRAAIDFFRRVEGLLSSYQRWREKSGAKRDAQAQEGYRAWLYQPYQDVTEQAKERNYGAREDAAREAESDTTSDEGTDDRGYRSLESISEEERDEAIAEEERRIEEANPSVAAAVKAGLGKGAFGVRRARGAGKTGRVNQKIRATGIRQILDDVYKQAVTHNVRQEAARDEIKRLDQLLEELATMRGDAGNLRASTRENEAAELTEQRDKLKRGLTKDITQDEIDLMRMEAKALRDAIVAERKARKGRPLTEEELRALAAENLATQILNNMNEVAATVRNGDALKGALAGALARWRVARELADELNGGAEARAAVPQVLLDMAQRLEDGQSSGPQRTEAAKAKAPTLRGFLAHEQGDAIIQEALAVVQGGLPTAADSAGGEGFDTFALRFEDGSQNLLGGVRNLESLDEAERAKLGTLADLMEESAQRTLDRLLEISVPINVQRGERGLSESPVRGDVHAFYMDTGDADVDFAIDALPDHLPQDTKDRLAGIMLRAKSDPKAWRGYVDSLPTPADRRWAESIARGDWDAAQRAVDGYARGRGYTPREVYHGTEATDRPWFVFDSLKGREANWKDEVRTPIFFALDTDFPMWFRLAMASDAKIKAAQAQIAASPAKENETFDEEYARAEKENAILEAAELTDEDREKVFASTRMIGAYLDFGKVFDSSSPKKIRELMDSAGADGIPLAMQRNLLDIAQGWRASPGAPVGNWTIMEGAPVQQWLKDNGYDSYIGIENGGLTIGVFDNTRIKSSDVATFDDNGEPIPPSRRFDRSTPDIRYMDTGDGGGTLSPAGRLATVGISNAAIEALAEATGTPHSYTPERQHAVDWMIEGARILADPARFAAVIGKEPGQLTEGEMSAVGQRLYEIQAEVFEALGQEERLRKDGAAAEEIAATAGKVASLRAEETLLNGIADAAGTAHGRALRSRQFSIDEDAATILKKIAKAHPNGEVPEATKERLREIVSRLQNVRYEIDKARDSHNFRKAVGGAVDEAAAEAERRRRGGGMLDPALELKKVLDDAREQLAKGAEGFDSTKFYRAALRALAGIGVRDPDKAMDYLERMAGKLGLPEDQTDIAAAICGLAEKDGSGRARTPSEAALANKWMIKMIRERARMERLNAVADADELRRLLNGGRDGAAEMSAEQLERARKLRLAQLEARMAKVKAMLRTGAVESLARKANPEIEADPEVKAKRAELKALQQELAAAREKAMFEASSAAQKFGHHIRTISDQMKSLVASGDFSSFGVQAAPLVLALAASSSAGAVPESIKKAVVAVCTGRTTEQNAEAAQRMLDDIYARSRWSRHYGAAGLALTSLTADAEAAHEEAFSRASAQGVLGAIARSDNAAVRAGRAAVGQLQQRSETAFAVPLNILRSAAFDIVCNDIARARGSDPTIDEMRAVATIVNEMSGRGDVKVNGRSVAGLLGKIYWAPRRMMGQVQYLGNAATMGVKALTSALGVNGGAGVSLTENARALGGDAARQLFKDMYARPCATYGALALLASAVSSMLWPDDDDDDQRIVGKDFLNGTSAKFLKFKIGGRYISATGNLEQYIRTANVLARGHKTTSNGEVKRLGDFGAGDATDLIVDTFFVNKAAPQITTALNILNRQERFGEKLESPGDVAMMVVRNLGIPLTWRDIAEVYDETDSVTATLGMAGLALLGYSGWSDRPKPNSDNYGSVANTWLKKLDEAKTQGQREAVFRQVPALRAHGGEIRQRMKRVAALKRQRSAAEKAGRQTEWLDGQIEREGEAVLGLLKGD